MKTFMLFFAVVTGIVIAIIGSSTAFEYNLLGFDTRMVTVNGSVVNHLVGAMFMIIGIGLAVSYPILHKIRFGKGAA